jgi:hypothetical protein
MRVYRLNQREFRAWRDRGAREALKARVFNEHGTTQLRAANRRILGTARSTAARVPIEQAIVRGAHHAPSPAECICREWQKPEGKQDEHHPICVNKSAWEAQLAHSPDIERERALLSLASVDTTEQTADSTVTAPREADGAPKVEPSLAPAPIAPAPAPASCICSDWSEAENGKHHPLCEFRERWEREHGIPTPELVELETGHFVREATAEEIEASRAKQAEDGVGAVELSDGKLYYVR